MAASKALPDLPPATGLHPRDELLVSASGHPRRATLASVFATRGHVFVNDFGAVADGISHPLSESYASLEAAKADYPAAQALTDEKDWCAWQAASDYVYATNDSPRPDNWSAARFVADGNYILNRTVTFNHVAAIVEGTISASRFAFKGGTSVSYRGPNGTVDEPVYLFDFYLFDEKQRGSRGSPNYVSGAPKGRKANDPNSGGGIYQVRNITFRGKDGDMRADVAGISGFVSGIRVRKGYYCHIADCHFSGTLWDAIKFTDAQLFAKVERNFFYSVHRDAISFDRATNFSTTTWIWWNEFGFVGRYPILQDMSGSVEAMPVICDNSFEHSYDSFFTRHPEWFIHGLVAGICVIGGGNAVIERNRFESVTDQPPFKHWADVHLVACTRPAIRDGIHRNIAFTALPARGPWRTERLIEYLRIHGHTDITDLRNYNIGGIQDHLDTEGAQIENIYNLGKILVADGVGLSTSNTHSARSVGFSFWSIPLAEGDAATKRVRPRPGTVLTLSAPVGVWTFLDVSLFEPTGSRLFGHSGRATADYVIVGGGRQWSAQSPSELNSLIVPAAASGFIYQAVDGGTSGSVEPSWPRVLGQSVGDGGVTWKCVGLLDVEDGTRAAEWRTGTMRNRMGTAPPISGSWRVGDKIWNQAPSPGGSIGWVCVANGSPGAWRSFGSVAS